MNHLVTGIDNRVRYHWTPEGWHQEESQVVQELPVTLFVNGAEYVSAALTPIDLKDWVLGLLAGDGVITRAEQVTIFQWHSDPGQIWVRVPGYHPRPEVSRYLGSCCGQSRPLFFDVHGQNPCTVALTVNIADIQASYDNLTQWSQSQHSGGLHVAGAAQNAHLFVARADVGRHNALDKVYGALLRQPPVSKDAPYLLFSGRLSAEIVWKVRRMNCPIIVSNAAPTTLGITLADQLGITLIGFLRDQELSVYTHPQRLTPAP